MWAECRPPGVPLLQAFARLYQSAPADLVEGTDYTPPGRATAGCFRGDARPNGAGGGGGAGGTQAGGPGVGGRRVRLAAGLNQRQLASRLGYSRGQVAGAEAGTQSTAMELWRPCDRVLDAGGTLVAAREQVEAASRALREVAVGRVEANREARLQRWRAENGLPRRPRPTSSLRQPQQPQPETPGTRATLMASLESGSGVQLVRSRAPEPMGRIEDDAECEQGREDIQCDFPSIFGTASTCCRLRASILPTARTGPARCGWIGTVPQRGPCCGYRTSTRLTWCTNSPDSWREADR
jgi:transcriptional regulator with XRE-family HTH domain